MAKLNKFTQLPLEISSKTMLPHLVEGEPVIVLILLGVGNASSFRMSGKTNRTFRFEWKNQQHEVRIPLSLWQMDKLALAREAFEQKLHYPVLVTIQYTPAVPASYTEFATAIEALTAKRDALQAEVYELVKRQGELLKVTDAPLATKPAVADAETPETDATNEPEPEPELTPEILRKVVGGLDKNTRAKDLAEEMGISADTLRSVAALPESGVTINQQGWIKLTEQAPD